MSLTWSADTSGGSWLASRLDSPPRGTMHDVVPRGFPGYARIFHPGVRSRLVDSDGGEIEDEVVTWAQAAAAMGTAMHPLAQWHALVAPGSGDAGLPPRDGRGWAYQPPAQGRLDPALLVRLATVLAGHTRHPESGYIAIWDGWGGLLGFQGDTPARTLLQPGPDVEPGHQAMLARSLPERFRGIFARTRWVRGILSDEISHGPRLALPERNHVLFSGGIEVFTSASWELDVPWSGDAEDGGAQLSPSLIWPADRAWVLVSDVDYDSTVVAGPEELIAAIAADPDLEAAVIGPDADLIG